MDNDPTSTQKLWAPVADLGNRHLEAFNDLRTALARGDIAGAEAAKQQIEKIQQESVEVHAAARKHALAYYRDRQPDLQRPVSA